MIDVLGPEKRRRRSVQEKIAIVQQSFEPGMTVSLVARQHGVAASQLFLWRKLNRPGFPGEYFGWELRLPDPYSRWKHNMPVRLLPVGYAPAFPATGDCCTSPPTPASPAQPLHGFSSFVCVSPQLCTGR